MSEHGWKLTFPEGTFKTYSGKTQSVKSLEIAPGQVLHARFPQMRDLQDYVETFHQGISRASECGVYFNGRRLSRDEIMEQTRFIPHTRIPPSLKNLPLQKVMEFWNGFQASEVERTRSVEVFSKLLLERWLEYRWDDVPARVQILSLLAFISGTNQFVTLILPDTRMPESELNSLYQGVRNLAEQKKMCVILMSRSPELEKLCPNISYNGIVRKQRQDKDYERDDEEMEDLD